MKKILSIENKTVNVNGAFQVEIKEVVWVLVKSETSRTYKIDRIGVSVYCNGKLDFKGLSVRFFRDKGVSINKKNPLESKSLNEIKLDRVKNESFQDSMKKYLLTLKNLEAKVLFFEKKSGEGMVSVPSLNTTFSVYACNLKGKKTWYAETACVYLERDQMIMIDNFAEVSEGITAIVNEGVKFDQEKWNSLDQSKLAFKCNDQGEATNGLFS